MRLGLYEQSFQSSPAEAHIQHVWKNFSSVQISTSAGQLPNMVAIHSIQLPILLDPIYVGAAEVTRQLSTWNESLTSKGLLSVLFSLGSHAAGRRADVYWDAWVAYGATLRVRVEPRRMWEGLALDSG